MRFRPTNVRRWLRLIALPLLPFLHVSPLPAQASAAKPLALGEASLEDLMNIEVTSVSRKEQKLSRTPAAVFVITADDIHRSGADNIPDLLRMAPGVNVERVDSNTWAISIRGFDSRYSDKILVLIDGRSIYSPSFSGVYWDQLDVPLEDIERIEVIRGPGGTAWGANAMNGVINVITRSSSATQGASLVARAGSRELDTTAQYGGKAGAVGTWRAFGRYFNIDSSIAPSSAQAADGWHGFHGGARVDLAPSQNDSVMVQGDLYKTAEGQTITTVLSDHLPAVATFNDPITVDSGDLQARWTHTLHNGSETSLNVYYNHVNRLDQLLVENLNSFDVDFQHHIALNSRNDLVWGLAWRLAGDTMNSGYDSVWVPANRVTSLYSAFVQDEIKVARKAWFTLGTKLEHNAYTGFEYEPGAQFTWTPTDRQTLWFSAAQAIRQPSRQDTDLQYDAAIIPLDGNNFGVLRYVYNKNVQAEQLRDYEAGYRTQLTKRFSLDVAAFRGYYRRLETSAPADSYVETTQGVPHVVFPIDLGNAARSRTWGGEVFATWNVNNRWRISPSVTLLHWDVIENPGSSHSTAEAIPGDTPTHQFNVRSSFDLRRNLGWDTSLYFVGQLDDAKIDRYARLDMQLRWKLNESLELGLTGQNLLAARHRELDDAYEVQGTEVRRSISARLTWRF